MIADRARSRIGADTGAGIGAGIGVPAAIRFLAALCLLMIAALAFRVSYRAIAEVWVRVGAGDPADAWAIPLIIDGMIIVCSLVALAAAVDGRRVIYPWVLVGAACAVSVVVNVAHATDHAGARALAAVAPLALLVTAEMFVRDLRRAMLSRASASGSSADTGRADTAPAAPAGMPQAPSVAVTVNNLNASHASADASALSAAESGVEATAEATADNTATSSGSAMVSAGRAADRHHPQHRVNARLNARLNARATAAVSVRELVAAAYRAHVDAGNPDVSGATIARTLRADNPGVRIVDSTVRGELARCRASEAAAPSAPSAPSAPAVDRRVPTPATTADAPAGVSADEPAEAR